MSRARCLLDCHAVGACKFVVDLHVDSAFEDELDLFHLGEVERDRWVKLDAPHLFATVADEGFEALVAHPEF